MRKNRWKDGRGGRKRFQLVDNIKVKGRCDLTKRCAKDRKRWRDRPSFIDIGGGGARKKGVRGRGDLIACRIIGDDDLTRRRLYTEDSFT